MRACVRACVFFFIIRFCVCKPVVLRVYAMSQMSSYLLVVPWWSDVSELIVRRAT